MNRHRKTLWIANGVVSGAVAISSLIMDMSGRYPGMEILPSSIRFMWLLSIGMLLSGILSVISRGYLRALALVILLFHLAIIFPAIAP